MSQLAATPAEPPQLAPARSRATWLVNLLLALAAILLLSGVVVGALYWRIHLERQQAIADVQTELDRIRAAGEPITPEEMHRFHQGGPRSAEKAKLWLAAIQAMPDADDDSDEESALLIGLGLEFPASPLAGDELALAEKLLEKRSEAMNLAVKAAQFRADARFPIQFEKGIAAETKHVGGLVRLARLFALQLRVAIARGDAIRAIASLDLILATAEALEFEPQMISQLIRMTILRTHCRELVPLLESLKFTDEQLADLQNRTARIDFQTSFRLSLLGERASGYHAFHYLTDDLEESFGDGESGDATLRRPADFRYYLGVMRQLLTAAESALPDARAQAMRVDATVEETLQSRWKEREFAVSTLLVPPGIKSFDWWAKAESIRDSAVAAIAFRRYQLAHGRPPESLEALCPHFLTAVPQDPFANSPAPLRLVVTDDRFAIYSVGENGSDDGSLLADPESADDAGIVVRLSLPAESNSTKTAPE